MPNVLVVANILHKKEGEFADVLRSAGLTIQFPRFGFRQLVEAELAEELAEIDATIAGSEPYTAAIFERHPRLRVVARTGVGFDAIDVDAACKHNAAVALAVGVNQESVAEQAFALLLATARSVVSNHLNVVGGGFDRPIPAPLRGRILGLIGYGRTGRAMAARANAFGMPILAYDPLHGVGASDGVQFVSLDEALAGSDYLSLHAPLTPQTRKLICAETIAKMKPGVRLVNTSRGGLVDEADLAAALRSGRIAGAGLDVFESEPPVGSPLLTAPNVVLAPHLAGIDSEACEKMGLMAAQNIVDLYQGRWPAERIVNAGSLVNWRW